MRRNDEYFKNLKGFAESLQRLTSLY